MVSNLPQTIDVLCCSCFSPPYWFPILFVQKHLFNSIFLTILFFSFLATLTFFFHSLTHELLAGWLRKRPTWRQGSHTAEARTQPLLLHPCVPVNESHCQPCHTLLGMQGGKRGPSKGTHFSKLCLKASMNLGLHYQY